MQKRLQTDTFATLACLLIFIHMLLGCSATTERHHPNYKAYMGALGTLLIMPPQFHITEEMADGSLLYKDKLSLKAQTLSMEATGNAMSGKQYRVHFLDETTANSDEVHQITALFRSVNKSIQLHTYGPQPFPHKTQSFEYAVGPVDRLLNDYRADAMVLIAGKETISKYQPRVWVSIAVVEPQGQIMWYSLQSAKENLQLNDIDNMALLINKTLQTFPGNAQ